MQCYDSHGGGEEVPEDDLVKYSVIQLSQTHAEEVPATQEDPLTLEKIGLETL